LRGTAADRLVVVCGIDVFRKAEVSDLHGAVEVILLKQYILEVVWNGVKYGVECGVKIMQP